MHPVKTIHFQLGAPQVVAIVHSERGLAEAREIGLETANVLEFRADLLQSQLFGRSLRRNDFSLPIILTVRSLAEGGAGPADDAKRVAMFLELLEKVQAVDVELASRESLASVIDQAKVEEIPLIFSIHDFSGTPSVLALRRQIDLATASGAALCKIATMVNTPADLIRLLHLLDGESPLPLSVMGMGKFGKISRPLLAQAGSCLNYGYLDRPLVSGQWPAAQLKNLIQSLED